jgi:hypothetical protein
MGQDYFDAQHGRNADGTPADSNVIPIDTNVQVFPDLPPPNHHRDARADRDEVLTAREKERQAFIAEVVDDLMTEELGPAPTVVPEGCHLEDDGVVTPDHPDRDLGAFDSGELPL